MFADVRFIPPAFELVELADQPQDQLHGFGFLADRFDKVASGMRPAADPHDAFVSAHVAGVRFIAVRLQNALEAFEQRRQFAMTTGQPPVEDDIGTGSTDDPQITLSGAAAFFIGIITSDRCFVGLEVIASEETSMQVPVNRFQTGRGHLHPIRHRTGG